MSKNTTPPEGYDVQREQMLDFKVLMIVVLEHYHPHQEQ